MSLQEISKLLDSNGVDSPRLDALALLEHVTGRSKALILADSFTLTSKQRLNLEELVNRRLNGEPLAYLVGTKEFYGRDFYVDRHVLIPRPESEDIIDIAKGLQLPLGSSVLDIGTGSGCLGLTYALEVSAEADSRLWLKLSDISHQAIEIAKRNADTYKVNARYVHANLLKEPRLKKPIDLLLANLPYVPQDPSYQESSPGLKHEPSIALYSGIDGLAHYQELLRQIKSLPELPKNIILEALPIQHKKLTSIAHEAGYSLAETRGLALLFTPYK